jgi:hypothetical protein
LPSRSLQLPARRLERESPRSERLNDPRSIASNWSTIQSDTPEDALRGHFTPGSHGGIDTESQAGRADGREAVDSCVSRLGWCWLAENAPSSIGEVIPKERCSEGLTVHRDVQTAPRTAAGMSTANEVTTHASGGPLVDIIHRLSNRRDVDGAECSTRQDDGARWVQEASRSPGHA